jgi:hypothetical protein
VISTHWIEIPIQCRTALNQFSTRLNLCVKAMIPRMNAFLTPHFGLSRARGRGNEGTVDGEPG